MDEARLIRALFGRPAPPAAAVTARSRAAALAAAGGSPVRRAARRRLPGALITAAATAVLGVAAGVAVAVVGLAPVSRHDHRGGSPAGSARQFLLAAASSAAHRPLRTGRYWHVLIHESYPAPVQAHGVRFTVIMEDRQESWTSAVSRIAGRVIYQTLGFRPATAADEAAWRRAGSPATVWIRGVPPLSLPMGRGPVQVSAGGSVLPGGLNLHNVQDLPSDPAMLKARLLRAAEHFETPATLPSSDRESYRLFEVAAALCRTAPLSPAVTAATFRMLAGLPGITKINNVKDGEGRSGGAVAMAFSASKGGTGLDRLILDPATGNVLGDSVTVTASWPGLPWLHPGGLLYDDTVVTQGWTNTPPKNS